MTAVKIKKLVVSLISLLCVLLFVILLSVLPKTLPTSATGGGATRGATGDLWADIILGKRDFGEVTTKLTVPNEIQSGGVVRDPNLNKLYIWDTMHSRILGVDLDDCYSILSPTEKCEGELVIGQPSMTDWGACNRDASFQYYPDKSPSSAETLCGIQEGTHTVLEDKSYVNMYVDEESNLYVYDAMNNRVLKYDSPYTTDTIADEVWGQPDFESNDCNLTSVWGETPVQPTNQSLCFHSINGVGAGVTLDPDGNLWVADGGNNRVLRFPNNEGTISKTADIVLGQENFTTGGDWSNGDALDRMFMPGSVRFGSDGNLYVMDLGNARILRFDAPYTSGMDASQVVLDAADFPEGLAYFEMEPNGDYFWTGQGNAGIPLFKKWDLAGNYQGVSFEHWLFEGGSIAFDADNNILLPNFGVTKFNYNSLDETYTEDTNLFTPVWYGVATMAFGRFGSGGWGGLEIASNGQLIVTNGRLLFWDDPINATNGQDPDGYAGAAHGLDESENYSLSAIDGNDILYVQQGPALDETNIRIFQAPLTTGESPIAELDKTYDVLGGGTLTIKPITGLAASPDGQFLWIADGQNNRVIRVRDPLTDPIVDVILGQLTISGDQCNRELYSPGDPDVAIDMICVPGGLKYDTLGNFYVSDHFYEAAGNLRMLMFEAGSIPDNPLSVVFAPEATKEFPIGGDDNPDWHSTFTPGFDSTNRMVVGYNPYAGKRFLDYYNNPAMYNPSDPGDPAYAVPDGQINDFYGWVFDIEFDANDNLYTYDGNRGNVKIYFSPFSDTPTPTPTPSVTPPSVQPGTLWSFGFNLNGATGLGISGGSTLAPTQVGSDSNWVTITTGFARTHVVKADGTLWSFGNNLNAATGLGTTSGNTLVPTQVGSDSNWITVSAGNSHSLALKENGTMWSWGSNSTGTTGLGIDTGNTLVPTQVGSDSDWIVISAKTHSLALKEDGTMWSWGSNANGATGLGTDSGLALVPTQVGSANDWVAVSAGQLYSLALKEDGTLWSFGGNNNGSTGLGIDSGNTLVPTQVGSDSNWVAISAGEALSLALKEDGTLWSFGINAHGRTGLGTTIGNTLVPTQVGSDSNWAAISAGSTHSLALKENGTLWSFGSNFGGQTGLGTDSGNTLVPTQVGAGNGWRQVSAGSYHSEALNATYTLTYNAGSNGNISGTTPQTVAHGGSGSEVTAVPDSGYEFVNWSDSSTANPRTDINVTGDITVTANFALVPTPTPSPTSTPTPTPTLSPTPTVTPSSTPTVTPTPSGSVTPTPSPTPLPEYILTYAASSHGSLSGAYSQIVEHGSSGSPVTAIPNAGYVFIGWTDGSKANPRTDFNVTHNITVIANFGLAPTPTPSLTVTPTPTPTETSLPTETPTPSPSPSPTTTFTPTPSQTFTTGDVDNCPVISSFSASKGVVTPGEDTVLSWKVSNANSIEIQSYMQNAPPNGSLTVKVNNDLRIQLIASNSDCTKEKTVSITVLAVKPETIATGAAISFAVLEVATVVTTSIAPTVTSSHNILSFGFAMIDRVRRRYPWGVVYDSKSKKPLSRVIVRAINTQNQKVVTSVTDAYGIFRMFLKKGIYRLVVNKPEYRFPSALVTTAEDSHYLNVYRGEEIVVAEDGDLVIKNIPIDPLSEESVSWLQNLWIVIKLRLEELNTFILFGGFAFSIYSAFVNPSAINYIFVSFYIILAGIKLLLLQIPTAGKVKTSSGQAVKGIEIGLFDAEFNSLVTKTFTDGNGQFSFYAKNDTYIIKVLDADYELVGGDVYDGVAVPKEFGFNGVRLITKNITVQKKNVALKMNMG